MEKLSGKGNNTERISALEDVVKQVLESTEAHRVEVAAQMGQLTRAINELTVAVGIQGKPKQKKKRHETSSESEDEEEEDGKSDESDSDTSRKSKKTKSKRGPIRDYRKMTIPIFNGEDVHGWIYRIERYFEVQDFKAKDQLRAVGICLEGPPLAWFRWTESRSPFRSWKRFKRKLLDRFQQSREGSIREQFLSIQQEGTVRDYVDRFESFAGQLLDVPDDILESTFIKGLKAAVRSEVRIAEPGSLAQAIRIAIKIDDNKWGGSVEGKSGIVPKTDSGDISTPTASVKTERGPGDSFKRLTEAEYTEKRAKGLCFKCDGKFGPGHRCPSKNLQVLIVDEESEEEEGGGKEEHMHFD